MPSCTEWSSCNEWSPLYTGTCCRFCNDEKEGKYWDCKEFSNGEITEAVDKATVTGKVTPEGNFQVDDGQEIMIAGDKIEALTMNMDKTIEIKGTVEVASGTPSIDVLEYKVIKQDAGADEGVKDAETGASCSDWANCNEWSPLYTGTCCRFCSDQEEGNFWDCKMFSLGEHFEVAGR